MKKVSLVLALLLVAVFSASVLAQAPDYKFVGAKVGLGTYLEGGIPFGVNFEVPMKTVNPNLGIGGQFMYQGYSQDYNWGFNETYTWTWSYIVISAYGIYYLDFLKSEKLKAYGKLHLGYNVASVTFESSVPGLESYIPKQSAGGFFFGLNAGVKYMFTPNVAGVAELGYGLSILQIGVEYGF